MGRAVRAQFAETHRDVLLLEPGDRAGLERYLIAQRLVASDELPARVEPAGSGNMNLTLRIRLSRRSLIVKQGRPWVEKYDHIEAPWERTLIEGQFYEAVRHVPAVAGRMPQLVQLDRHNHVLVLEDVGCAGDFTSMYADRTIAGADLSALLDWLAALGRLAIPEESRAGFANRAMRALNHEHIFRLPLAERNGLDLDRITDGLGRAADELKGERTYCSRVSTLGDQYLSDGAALVHGDYFPGSWVQGEDGIRIIDPEFCFLGARAFDYGVMLGHLALARTNVDTAGQVLAASDSEQIDTTLVLAFAGVEIMRRLIGVAQLPLPYGLDAKRHLLDVSRSFLQVPEGGLTCWP
jgi:5-methylthioribose kinase